MRKYSTTVADVISIIEAAYHEAPSPSQWLAHLLEALRSALDTGLGICGFFYQFTGDTLSITDARLAGTAFTGSIQEVVDQVMERSSPESNRLFFASDDGFTTASGALRLGDDIARHPAFSGFLESMGIADCRILRVRDVDGQGCFFAAPTPVVVEARPKERWLWNRVVSHIAAGLRLERSALPEAEAVLTPEGRLCHADGEAKSPAWRQALSESVKHRERARGRLRKTAPADAVNTHTA